MHLFQPLGRVKIEDDYFICDLSELRKHLKEKMDRLSTLLD